MRVVCFVNNWIGWRVLEFIHRTDEIVGLVIHPKATRTFGEKILGVTKMPGYFTFPDADRLGDLGAEMGVSAFYGYILRKPVLDLFPIVNLHTAYLPFNRGKHPNVWSIIEDNPAGVTLHYMDEGIDTGDIIVQREVEVHPWDTAETLYDKLGVAAIDLFREEWAYVRTLPPGKPQGQGTHHYAKELETLSAIDPDRLYAGRDLINILRARTFPPHSGAYIESDGVRVDLKIVTTQGEQGCSQPSSQPPLSPAP